MMNEPIHEFGLSKRETEIAGMLTLGLSAKEVSKRLKISAETVRSHTRSIYLKMRVRNRVELVRKMFHAAQRR